MFLPLRVARRYFFSKKKTQFINLISVISMLVVAVGTAALIIALSVFNGLEGVVRGLHHTFNPDLQITAIVGKSFKITDEMRQKIQKTTGVAQFSEVIEDNAVLNYKDEQMVVTIKGVSKNFTAQSRIDTALLEGKFRLEIDTIVGEDTIRRNFAVLGRGVQIKMGISVRNHLDHLQLWYPKRTRSMDKIMSSANAERNFTKKGILPAGIFSLEQHYDEKYVFVPLQFAEQLLEYEDLRTAIEVKVQNPADITEVQTRLRATLGKDFVVRTSDEQNVTLLRAIKIEKFFMYITLSFILAVASFNIFFALMMLVIEKQKDIAVLQSIGATGKTIGQIFFLEGAIIAFVGALVGLVLGTSVCVLQQMYGFVQMGAATMVVNAYPVKLQADDFFYTILTIIFITLLSSLLPAIKAAKLVGKDYL